MLLLIEDGYSGTVLLGEDHEELLGRYLELLRTPKEELRKHDGYAPGCYAEGHILGGMYGREKWVDPRGEPSYTREKLQELIKEGSIRIRELKSGVVMFSYLDG